MQAHLLGISHQYLTVHFTITPPAGFMAHPPAGSTGRVRYDRGAVEPVGPDEAAALRRALIELAANHRVATPVGVDEITHGVRPHRAGNRPHW